MNGSEGVPFVNLIKLMRMCSMYESTCTHLLAWLACKIEDSSPLDLSVELLYTSTYESTTRDVELPQEKARDINVSCWPANTLC